MTTPPDLPDETDGAAQPPAYEGEEPKKKKKPHAFDVVFGWVLICWAGISVITMMGSVLTYMINRALLEAIGTMWTVTSMSAGFVIVGMLFGTGYGLVKKQAWARKLGTIYVASAITLATLSLILTNHAAVYSKSFAAMNMTPEIEGRFIMGTAVGVYLISIAFPIGIAIVLNLGIMKRAIASRPDIEESNLPADDE